MVGRPDHATIEPRGSTQTGSNKKELKGAILQFVIANSHSCLTRISGHINRAILCLTKGTTLDSYSVAVSMNTLHQSVQVILFACVCKRASTFTNIGESSNYLGI